LISIAPLRKSDIDGVADLWRAAGLGHPWNDSRRDIELALGHPTNLILTAHDQAGTLVGTIMAGFDGHRGWIYALAVDGSRRGQGIGRQLVERAEAWLAEQGAPVVRLLVQGGNEKAAGFYEACGYEREDFIVFGKKMTG
jgi:ribosomal protein S18 acetylase RimI-like enzyme